MILESKKTDLVRFGDVPVRTLFKLANGECPGAIGYKTKINGYYYFVVVADYDFGVYLIDENIKVSIVKELTLEAVDE